MLPPDLTPVHHDLVFKSPMSEARASTLSAFVARTARGTIVDAGCGWAGLLMRVLQQSPTLRGLGVDLDADAIAHGRERAETHGVADRLRLDVGDAKAVLPAQAGGALCIGASQIWGPPVEEHGPLDYAAALRALRGMLDRGAPLVYGEGIWSTPPTREAIAPLAGRVDEFVFLPELLDITRECGFIVVGVGEATLDEWDRFESGFTARFARWLATNPADHEAAAKIRARLRSQSDAYFRGYRGVLGMAYLELLAD